ncbi:MAG TPA: NUDIX hydrolase [Opitutus sp.]|nr:NUDIX hydrolase [Opitutus sp.]
MVRDPLRPADPRESVVGLLRKHAARQLEAHEAAMVKETIRFVERHEDCLLRSCVPGHLTGSAWIVDAMRSRTLLTHHRKLDKWLQLGGHADGDPDLVAVALREAREESGLSALKVVSGEIFDFDRHWIPERKGEPAHYHYDLRFLIEADPGEPLVVTSESKDLAWVDLAEVARLNPEESMARMVRKTVSQERA